MAVVGPVVSYGLYKCWTRRRRPREFGVCLRFAGSLATYVVTSLQLALAFPAEVGGGVAASFAKFAGIFAVTQLPLSAVEGLLTVYVLTSSWSITGRS